jgi:hypothetical protein
MTTGKQRIPLLLTTFLAFGYSSSEAHSAICDRRANSPIGSSTFATVGKLTVYTPSAGGTNGSCRNNSAGGISSVCNYNLEDHLKGHGRAPHTLVAIPRTGQISKLAGGMYQATSLEQRLGRGGHGCIKVIACDTYGSGSNNMSKMDILMQKWPSEMAGKVTSTRNAEFVLIGQAPRQCVTWGTRVIKRRNR